MSLVQPEDVMTGYEADFPDADLGKVQALIDEAELELETKLVDLPTWAAGNAKRLQALKIVVRRMVHRVLRAVAGGAMNSQTAGPFAYTINPLTASGTVWVTRQDWRLLGVRNSRAGTIRVGLPSWSPRTPS